MLIEWTWGWIGGRTAGEAGFFFFELGGWDFGRGAELEKFLEVNLIFYIYFYIYIM